MPSQAAVTIDRVSGDKPKYYGVAVSGDGRMAIPVAVRRALGIDGRPAHVMICAEDGEFRLTTRVRQLRRAREIVARLATKSSVRASDELISERRAEARRESNEG